MSHQLSQTSYEKNQASLSAVCFPLKRSEMYSESPVIRPANLLPSMITFYGSQAGCPIHVSADADLIFLPSAAPVLWSLLPVF